MDETEDEDLEFLNFEAMDVFENEDGGVDLVLDPEINVDTPSTDHFENLAERLEDDELEKISTKVLECYQTDKESRSNWEKMTIDFIDNLGLVYEEGTEPFSGACTATHPIILESCVKFQSKISNELLPASGPVKTKIIGKQTEERLKQAKRVKDDLNYTLTEVVPEYYPESEKSFFITALIGNAFKKTSWDPVKNRPVSELIIDKLFVNQNATSLLSAERITHQYYQSPDRVEKLIDAGYYLYYNLEDELGQASSPICSEFEEKIREIQGVSSESKLYDEVYSIVEQHCNMKLFDDKVAKPYVIVVEENSNKVLSIRRNWDENDSSCCRLEWFTHYPFVPTAGFLALGYAHLLGNLQKTLTLAMRSLADAGQFANLPGGFKSAAARIIGDQDPISPGEWKDLEIPAIAKVSDVFHPLPYKEPSLVLFQLMQELTGVAQKFADSTEQVIADSTNYGPVGTTMALLEASTRFYAAVYKRQYKAQAQEFKIFSRLISQYAEDQYPYLIDNEQEHSRTMDYDPRTIDIIPVSDPNYSSQAQRISKAQMAFDAALKAPQAHNMREVLRDMYTALEVEDVDRLIGNEQKPEKREPIDDILAAIRGMPIAAFKGQNHDSHITVKMSWLQDPSNGGSESMAQFGPVILANIREHQFLKYAEEVGALQAQGIGVEEAAQRLSRINQIAKQEQEDGSPAAVIAKAEYIKAQTAAQREVREAASDRFKMGIDLLDKSSELEREFNRAQEAGRKLDMEKIKLAIDMLKAGATDINAQDKMDIEREKTKSKPKEK